MNSIRKIKNLFLLRNFQNEITLDHKLEALFSILETLVIGQLDFKSKLRR